MPDWEMVYSSLTFGGATNYGIKSVEGLSRPDSREDVDVRAGEHGAYIFANYLTERRVVITGDIVGTPGSDFAGKVDAWRSAFIPLVDPIPLVYTFQGDAQSRRVNAVVAKAGFTVDPMYSIGYAEWVVMFLCGDPRIYSNVEESTTINSGGGTNGMVFPEVFDMNFGGGNPGTGAVNNDGIFNSPPFIRIFGPATNPVIRNVTTGRELRFVITLTAGQYLEIDTLKRSVLLNGDTSQSRYSTLEQASKWWNIEPGSNTIQLQTGGTTSSASIQFRDSWI